MLGHTFAVDSFTFFSSTFIWIILLTVVFQFNATFPSLKNHPFFLQILNCLKAMMILHIQEVQTFPEYPGKKRNQLARATTGNRSNRGIKLAGSGSNAGSAHLHNKMDDLEQVVADHHPHVLGISKANFNQRHSLDDVQIQEYDLVLHS